MVMLSVSFYRRAQLLSACLSLTRADTFKTSLNINGLSTILAIIHHFRNFFVNNVYAFYYF